MNRKLLVPLTLIFAIAAAMLYQRYDAKKQLELLERTRLERLIKINEAYQNNVPETTKRKDALYNLQKNFVQLPKSFTGLRWQIHKHWEDIALSQLANTPTKALMVKVNQHGEVNLISHFTGTEPLQHTQLRVEVGTQIYDSTFIPNSSDIPVADYSTTEISFQEQLTFTSTQDVEIIRAIANSKSQNIHVKLLGYNRIEAFTLSKEDILAIKESWQLAKL